MLPYATTCLPEARKSRTAAPSSLSAAKPDTRKPSVSSTTRWMLSSSLARRSTFIRSRNCTSRSESLLLASAKARLSGELVYCSTSRPLRSITSAVLSCSGWKPRLVVAVRPRLISASSTTSNTSITRLKTKVLAKLMNLPTPTRKLQAGLRLSLPDDIEETSENPAFILPPGTAPGMPLRSPCRLDGAAAQTSGDAQRQAYRGYRQAQDQADPQPGRAAVQVQAEPGAERQPDAPVGQHGHQHRHARVLQPAQHAVRQHLDAIGQLEHRRVT